MQHSSRSVARERQVHDQRAARSTSGSPRLALVAMVVAVPLGAQPQWAQLSPLASPGARMSTAMAYDQGRGMAVIYGGVDRGVGALSDTWEWDGVTWSKRAPTTSPGVLNGHAMAYDSRRRVTVLFGGARNGTRGLGETWEWDGTTWAQRSITGPTGRVQPQLCYDSARGVVVLFGGQVYYDGGPKLGDTWEWNGVTWTLRASSGPAVRAGHAMAYDSVRARTVLFGGMTANVILLNDTWEWDGTTWTQVTPAVAPSARSEHGMAYDPVRQRCVVYAGFQTSTETWDWDGVQWSSGVMAPTPGPRSGYALCFDNQLHRLLLFGGVFQNVLRGDTWIHGTGVRPAYVLAGTGCPGSNGTPTIVTTDAPYLGQPFAVTVSGLGSASLGVVGASNTVWGRQPLPLDLGAIGMPGCRLYVSYDLAVAMTSVGGSTPWTLVIPNLAALIGGQFHQQVLTLASGANPLGLASSNYGTGTIGVR